MSEWIDKIDQIEERIVGLLKIQKQLKAENVALINELKNRQERILGLEKDLESLSNDNRNLKMANTLLGSDDFKHETKLKINSLVKEIDLCINQLAK